MLQRGIICALVTVLIAVMTYQPAMYIAGVLTYGFATGLMYAAFTAIIFFMIGKGMWPPSIQKSQNVVF